MPENYYKKPLICIIGPLPIPPNRISGPMISFELLCNYFKQNPKFKTYIINTARKNQKYSVNFFQALSILYRFIKKRKTIDYTIINMSPRGMMGLGFLLKVLSKRKSKVIIRFFGSSVDELIEDKCIKERILLNLFSADLILLQTKSLVDSFFKKFPESNIVWFPTSREPGNNNYINKEKISFDDKFRFVFIGHIKPTKGVLVIKEAVSILNNLKLGSSYYIDLYGDFRDGLGENDISGDNIYYRGHIKPGQAIKVLSKYDTLVFPTFHSGEGYPGVIIEAYMAGVPVITTKWKYIPEIISEDSGFLIAPKSSEELALTMANVIRNRSLLTHLKKGAFKKAQMFNSNYWNDWLIDKLDTL